jgi:hypothetical protein
MRVVRHGDFILPAVETVGTIPRRALTATMIKLAALSTAVATRYEEQPSADDPDDAIDATAASALLKLKSPRWLRSAEGRTLRCPRPVGGRWMYSRRKIAAFLRGAPVE